MLNKGPTNVKYLIFVIILAAIAGAVILWVPKRDLNYSGASWLLPGNNQNNFNPDPITADWKVFKNEDWGYEIKYPESGTLKFTKDKSYAYVEFLNIKPSFHKFFEIYFLDECRNVSGKETVNGIEFAVESGPRINPDMPETKGFIKNHYTPKKDGKCLVILYNFWGWADKEPSFDELFNLEEDSKVFDKIFSTFRFLD